MKKEKNDQMNKNDINDKMNKNEINATDIKNVFLVYLHLREWFLNSGFGILA